MTDGNDEHRHDQHGHDEHEATSTMTGNCDDALRELYTFLDGEIDDERRAQIRAHVEGCSPCLEAFDFEAELRLVIAAKCHDECPDRLRDRIAAAIDAEGGEGVEPSPGP